MWFPPFFLHLVKRFALASVTSESPLVHPDLTFTNNNWRTILRTEREFNPARRAPCSG